MTENELLYILALQKVPHVGDITGKKLLNHCGSAAQVFSSPKKQLMKIDGFGELMWNELQKPIHLQKAESELRFIKDQSIKTHFFLEEDYPDRLKQCIDGPIFLFSRGEINLTNKNIISIVGTRKVTTQGIAFIEKLIEHLKPYNPVIVSGFAYGCDITAQKAAIKNGLQTIGCLAHGLNQIYPKTHAKYVADIERHGGFYTDFWSSDDFDRNNFLKRNRIIAGLSEGTLVIESAEKGGSLVTADIAWSYNREVFAVPGRTTDNMSIGCNNLIKMQRAHLLSKPEDVPYILNWHLEDQKKPVQQKLFVELDPDEKVIYNYLKTEGKALLDLIALKCDMPTFRVASILLNMELKGVVRPLPGKQFEVT